MYVHYDLCWSCDKLMILAATQTITSNTLSRVSDLQAAKMISETKSDAFSEPTATLQIRLTFCRRHQARQKKDIERFWTSSVLKDWSCSTSSSIVLVQGSADKDFEKTLLGTTMVDYIRQSPIIVLWALQEPGSRKFAATTAVQLLKHLTAQAFAIRATEISENISADFNATRTASASTAEHWAEALKHALSCVPLVYIVVDLSLLAPENELQNEAAQLFVSLIRLTDICKPTRLKVALISKRRVQRMDYASSSPAILDIDKVMPSNSTAMAGQSRQRQSTGIRRSRDRGALAFRSGFR